MDDEKIRLLMETTGCNRYEAELAAKSSGGNFVEALNFLHNAMARLDVIRGKFIVKEQFIYGAFLFISDIKKGLPLAISVVVSKNPAVYEMSVSSDWEDIEKHIYSARLSVGSLPEISALLQEKFSGLVWMVCSEPSFDIEENIKKTLEEIFNTKNVQLAYERTEEPYKTPTSTIVGAMDNINKNSGEEVTSGLNFSYDEMAVASRQRVRAATITLDVEPLKLLIQGDNIKSDEVDIKDFVPASEVKSGYAIWVRIADSREVAIYLAERLGCYKEEKGFLPIVCEVLSVKIVGGQMVYEVKFTDNISGVCKVRPDENIKAVFLDQNKDEKFSTISKLWRKIFGRSIKNHL